MLTQTFEDAWREDEAVRIKEALRKEKEEEYWLKRAIRADEKSLPDYPRELRPDDKVYSRTEFTPACIAGFIKNVIWSMRP